ncbi:MAG: periplasmic heavy metal sensor [Sphingomonas sp.]|nr:periplasmic heavy metal sensor [Sphingomonas sp.]
MTTGRGALVILLALLAAIGGVWVGRQVFPAAPPSGSALHELIHEGLELDARQQSQIDVLERRFSLRRTALELELRADNARLAGAIEAEHGNGPQVSAAVDASHEAMGRMQKETLAHVFAMRAVLRRDQAEKFDRAVVQALTDDKR